MRWGLPEHSTRGADIATHLWRLVLGHAARRPRVGLREQAILAEGPAAQQLHGDGVRIRRVHVQQHIVQLQSIIEWSAIDRSKDEPHTE